MSRRPFTMLLGGLWHGAAWNFVLWGAWHGVGLAVQRSPLADSKIVILGPRLHRIFGWSATMLFVLYSWLLFRAESLGQIGSMTRALA